MNFTIQRRLKVLCIIWILNCVYCDEFVPLWKQVERAFSVCGTIEYMAPEIVEGGESGHDKVIFAFSFYTVWSHQARPVSPSLCISLRFFFLSLFSKRSWVGAFLHSRRWTGGASACWCTSFWLADHPSPLMEMTTRTQTLPSKDSPKTSATVLPALFSNLSTALTISVSHATGEF